MKKNEHLRRLEELAVFALFGALMFLTSQIDIIPNIHLLAFFILTLTDVYREKALIPIYLYVFLEGLVGGFGLWWIPYLYIWAILWALGMAVPKKLPTKFKAVIYIVIAGLHGISFGIMYAPFWCYTMYGGDWSLTLSWIISGAPFDLLHTVGNMISAILIIPMSSLIRKLKDK